MFYYRPWARLPGSAGRGGGGGGGGAGGRYPDYPYEDQGYQDYPGRDYDYRDPLNDVVGDSSFSPQSLVNGFPVFPFGRKSISQISFLPSY